MVHYSVIYRIVNDLSSVGNGNRSRSSQRHLGAVVPGCFVGRATFCVPWRSLKRTTQFPVPCGGSFTCSGLLRHRLRNGRFSRNCVKPRLPNLVFLCWYPESIEPLRLFFPSAGWETVFVVRFCPSNCRIIYQIMKRRCPSRSDRPLTCFSWATYWHFLRDTRRTANRNPYVSSLIMLPTLRHLSASDSKITASTINWQHLTILQLT